MADWWLHAGRWRIICLFCAVHVWVFSAIKLKESPTDYMIVCNNLQFSDQHSQIKQSVTNSCSDQAKRLGRLHSGPLPVIVYCCGSPRDWSQRSTWQHWDSSFYCFAIVTLEQWSHLVLSVPLDQCSEMSLLNLVRKGKPFGCASFLV